MRQFIKLLITSLIVMIAGESARRSPVLGALIVSLPLTSILAMTWLYVDTKNIETVSSMCTEIFWMVLPSLVFFLVFPALASRGWNFPAAMSVSCVLMIIIYSAFMWMKTA